MRDLNNLDNLKNLNKFNKFNIPEERLLIQRDYEKKIKQSFEAREAHPRACVQTFGCQQNVADSQILRGMLKNMGFDLIENPADADLILLNTCAVREHAEHRVFGHLGALTHVKRENPERIIILCGCMAGEESVRNRIRESYRHVDIVFDPHALWKFPELLWTAYHKRGQIQEAGPESGVLAEDQPMEREDGVRAWVSIMYGCDNFCSYCVVPYVRGRERSRDPEKILLEIENLIKSGYREINLLGQNVNSYGKNLDYSFTRLLREINQIPGDYWVRFMSSHPKDAAPELFDTMADCEHVAKQLHLPFQSGSNRILKIMNRRYTRERYLDLIKYARSVMPGLALTSDVIIGFPGETEADAMETISLVEEVGFDALFTFLYSPRPGTKAAEMPDPVSKAEKQVWFDKLLNIQNARSAAIHASYINHTVRVLIDSDSRENNNINNNLIDADFLLTARTEGNRLVRLKGDPALIGNFTNALITGSKTWALYGEII